MNKTYEVYEVAGGFAYRIFIDYVVSVDQEWKPDVSGFVRMTEDEALALALAEAA